MGKKILIIGNGFDLAHELPTKYSDFLEFSSRILDIYKETSTTINDYYKRKIIDWKPDNSEDAKRHIVLKDYIEKVVDSKYFKKEKTLSSEVLLKWDKFNEFLEGNIWYEYFVGIYKGNLISGDHWIDFESEMSYIIEIIDTNKASLKQDIFMLLKDKKIQDKKIDLFNHVIEKYYKAHKVTTDMFWSIKDLRKVLYEDLKKLTYAFEIFIECVISPVNPEKKIPYISRLKFNGIISFNYTKTYQNVYTTMDYNPETCYIHGVANEKIDDDNDMVLGIDEYYKDERKDTCTDFSIFKKFVQRIRNHNNVVYSSWIDDIEDDGKKTETNMRDKNGNIPRGCTNHISEVYILGHSLDVTDKDVLRRFIVSEYTRVHILTRNKSSEGSLISNLIKIASQETIIKKSCAYPPLILFEDYNQSMPVKPCRI